jgi:hypothetical protein
MKNCRPYGKYGALPPRLTAAFARAGATSALRRPRKRRVSELGLLP